MDERIKVRSYYSPKSNLHYAYVRVNDEPYASVSGRDKESVLVEAQHYAMQIEFDEWGNW